jgi:hypothetical protein
LETTQPALDYYTVTRYSRKHLMRRRPVAATPQRRNAATPQRRNAATPQRRNAATPQRRNVSGLVVVLCVSALNGGSP